MRKLCMSILGGGAVLLLASTTVLAGGGRSANIKSHGTLQYQNDSKDVTLTADDLVYLADECDKLETVIEGLRLTNNPNISYTLHHHTGSSYYYGGCYTSGYHVHSGDMYSCGGCYTDGYHVHTSACTRTHVHNSDCPMHKHSAVCGYHTHSGGCYTCNQCGNPAVYTGGDGLATCCNHHTNGAMNLTCTVRNKCNKTANSYECNNLPLNTYSCGEPDNRWSLSCGGLPINRYSTGCGWNENEIMEANIVFSK